MKRCSILLVALGLVGCGTSDGDTQEGRTPASAGAPAPEDEAGGDGAPASAYPTRAFFGDTYLHTSFSFDGPEASLFFGGVR